MFIQLKLSHVTFIIIIVIIIITVYYYYCLPINKEYMYVGKKQFMTLPLKAVDIIGNYSK